MSKIQCTLLYMNDCYVQTLFKNIESGDKYYLEDEDTIFDLDFDIDSLCDHLDCDEEELRNALSNSTKEFREGENGLQEEISI